LDEYNTVPSWMNKELAPHLFLLLINVWIKSTHIMDVTTDYRTQLKMLWATISLLAVVSLTVKAETGNFYCLKV